MPLIFAFAGFVYGVPFAAGIVWLAARIFEAVTFNWLLVVWIALLPGAILGIMSMNEW